MRSIGRLLKKRWIRWTGAGVVTLLIVALAAPFIYIHWIEGPPPPQLTLPVITTTTTTTTAVEASSGGGLTSTWNVGKGSIVGYRVSEVLVGQSTTAVGRSTAVWGAVHMKGLKVTSGAFTVEMATIVSDQPMRNVRFDGPIMDVADYPTATFKLTSPIVLGTTLPAGTIRSYKAKGLLTMHGVTKSIMFTLSAERSSSEFYVLTEIPIKFSNWNIANPSIGGVVTTANDGTLEVLLQLTKGAGNPAVTGVAPITSNGGDTTITVPSTTVPPLSSHSLH